MSQTIHIKDKVRAFFTPYLGSRSLEDQDEIFTGGIVNSMMAIQLVTFLESEFGITVESDDLNIDNFNSLDRIDAFVNSKSGN